MANARRITIDLESTPYYHCTSKCVRQAYLCGSDQHSGRSFEHRRAWVENGFIKLCQAFCIDVVAYAVMSNHYHVILHVDLDLLNNLTDLQVIDRYHLIYRPDPLMVHFRNGGEVTESEQVEIESRLMTWRDNLTNISRFIGYLNEQIARDANQEDGCKGRFWEGRFHSQALLDEAALLQCMTYVDLNPIRAGMAKTPETSDHTSIKRRITKRMQQLPDTLMAFCPSPNNPPSVVQSIQSSPEPTLPITFDAYLELLDWTGRILRDDKAGAIDPTTPDILTRLGFRADTWASNLTALSHWLPKAMGAKSRMKDYAHAIGRHWVWSIGSSPNV